MVKREMSEQRRYRFYEGREVPLGRKLVLDDRESLLGAGQVLRPSGEWVYHFLDPHEFNQVGEKRAHELAPGADIQVPVSGYSGDHAHERDPARWGRPGEGHGRALAGDMRDIEVAALKEGRELSLHEARKVAALEDRMRELYSLAREFSYGTPMPPVEVPKDRYRPQVELASTGGDWLKIGGTVDGVLARAEDNGRVPPGSACAFKREAMPSPFGEAPAAKYREMLRHLLATAANYVEVVDGYPEVAARSEDLS